MSLLQGLLGFGAGAAAGMADLKREEISNQRKANLARLQAQYKGEAEAQKLSAQREKNLEIYDLLQEDPEAGRRAAFGAGVPLPEIEGTATDTALIKNARAAYPDDLEMQRRFIRAGGDLGLGAPEIANTWKQDGYEFAKLTDGSIVRLDASAPGGMIPVSGPASTKTTNFVEDSSKPEQAVKAPEPPKSTVEKLNSILGENVANIPPQDIISLGTGPIDTLKSIGLRLPIIGDLLNAAGDEMGPAQERARIATQFIENKAITTYKQNEGRTSNLEMGLNLKLRPQKGFLSTDAGYYAALTEYRRNLFNDINYNLNILNDAKSPVPTFSSDDVSVARDFLRGSFGLLQTIDGVITAYGFQNETVPLGGRRVPIRNIDQNSIQSVDLSQLSSQQIRLLEAWETYNNWSGSQ